MTLEQAKRSYKKRVHHPADFEQTKMIGEHPQQKAARSCWIDRELELISGHEELEPPTASASTKPPWYQRRFTATAEQGRVQDHRGRGKIRKSYTASGGGDRVSFDHDKARYLEIYPHSCEAR